MTPHMVALFIGAVNLRLPPGGCRLPGALASLLRSHLCSSCRSPLGSSKPPQGYGGGILLSLGWRRWSFPYGFLEDLEGQLVRISGPAWALRHGLMVTRIKPLRAVLAEGCLTYRQVLVIVPITAVCRRKEAHDKALEDIDSTLTRNPKMA